MKLIDATEPGWSQEGHAHVELSYAAPESQRTFFTGTIEREGTVKGSVCPGCGRIILFAQPVEPDAAEG